jgi:hypothetical protein
MPFPDRLRNQSITIAILTQIPALLQDGESDNDKRQPQEQRGKKANPQRS